MNTLLRFLIVPLIAFAALSATAAEVLLNWSGNNAPGAVAYVVYNEQADGTWREIGSTAEERFTITGLTPGVYTYVVTARNGWGESAPSNEASTPPAATAPTNLRFTITVPDRFVRRYHKRGPGVAVRPRITVRNGS